MNKEKIKQVSKTGAKIGKRILVEGSKTLILGAVGVGLGKLFTEGVNGLKHTSLEEFLGINEVTEEVTVVEEIEEV